jgi:gliding motility-associated-like protein
MKKNDLEDLFKDKFENFEAEVNPSVWKNIQTGLKGAGLGVLAKMLLNKIGTNAIVAIVSSAAAVVGTVLVMNYSGNKTEAPKTVTPITPTKQIADKPIPSSVNDIKNFLANPETPVTTTVKEAPENNNMILSNKIDKKQIQKAISELSEDRVASISSNCVGGAVPLIINLSNSGKGKINKWSFNDGTKAITGINPIKVFDVPGIYTIKLTSTGVDGKIDVDSIKVEALANSSLPEGPADFSPNGDGVRDDFRFNGINMVSLEVKVADAKGEVVYYSNSTDAKWDGKTTHGKKAKEGIYYYFLSAIGKDGKKYKSEGKIKLTR